MIAFPLKVVGNRLPHEVGLQARVILRLQDKQRNYRRTEFILDTGSSVSQMSAGLAEEIGLRLPSETRDVGVMTASGKQTRRGRYGLIVVRFAEHPERLFAWDCWFLDDWPEELPPLLGLGGRVLNDLSITFAGSRVGFPNGTVTLEIVSPPLTQSTPESAHPTEPA